MSQPKIDTDYNPDEAFTPSNPDTSITPTEFARYLRSAESGNPESQLFVGWAYQNGIATEKDKIKAAYWYRKAADSGNPKGMFNTGVCYNNGYGVEMNMEKAVGWYMRAADMGHSEALLSLGWCYENGEGVEMDPERAVNYYRIAAEAGNATAQFNLAVCYEEGFGVEEDPVIAMQWYKGAAEKGDTGAAFLLGVAYENGMGVDCDPAAAVFWYEKAAEAGDAGAQFILGVAYESGFGVEPNSDKALDWFTRAAEQGYVYANIDNIGTEEQGMPENVVFDEEFYEEQDAVGMLPSEGGAKEDDRMSIASGRPSHSRKMSRRFSTTSWKSGMSVSIPNMDDSGSQGSPTPISPVYSMMMDERGRRLSGMWSQEPFQDDDDDVLSIRSKRLSTMSRRSSIYGSVGGSSIMDDTRSISGDSMMRRNSSARRPSRAMLAFV